MVEKERGEGRKEDEENVGQNQQADVFGEAMLIGWEKRGPRVYSDHLGELGSVGDVKISIRVVTCYLLLMPSLLHLFTPTLLFLF